MISVFTLNYRSKVQTLKGVFFFLKILGVAFVSVDLPLKINTHKISFIKHLDFMWNSKSTKEKNIKKNREKKLKKIKNKFNLNKLILYAMVKKTKNSMCLFKLLSFISMC